MLKLGYNMIQKAHQSDKIHRCDVDLSTQLGLEIIACLLEKHVSFHKQTYDCILYLFSWSHIQALLHMLLLLIDLLLVGYSISG